jgi:uncharacterized protein (DUF1778 family)
MIASERLAILVTPAQKKAMVQRAAAADLTLSEYVRQAALGELPPGLEELVEMVEESTRRANAALDDAFGRIEASRARLAKYRDASSGAEAELSQ